MYFLFGCMSVMSQPASLHMCIIMKQIVPAVSDASHFNLR